MRLYYDIKSASDCVGIFLKDTEIVAAGTTISAASPKNNNMELKRIADDYNIHCIFNDNIPTIDFMLSHNLIFLHMMVARGILECCRSVAMLYIT